MPLQCIYLLYPESLNIGLYPGVARPKDGNKTFGSNLRALQQLLSVTSSPQMQKLAVEQMDKGCRRCASWTPGKVTLHQLPSSFAYNEGHPIEAPLHTQNNTLPDEI